MHLPFCLWKAKEKGKKGKKEGKFSETSTAAPTSSRTQHRCSNIGQPVSTAEDGTD